MKLTYLRYYIKAELTNPYLWGWSVGFMLFWLVLGYMEIGSFIHEMQQYGLSPKEIAEGGLCYTAEWYASVAMIGLGSASVGLCFGTYFSSMSIRYVTKYSRLKAQHLFLQSLLGFVLVCLVISSILLASTMTLYSRGFDTPMTPRNPVGLFVTLIAVGVFYYVLSTTIVYSVIVARKPRAAMMMSYLPLVLSLGLVLTALNVDLYLGNVISPFNAAALLIFHYYTGKKPPITALSKPENIQTVDPYLLWLSLALWTLLLSITTIVLIRKQRGIGVEELF